MQHRIRMILAVAILVLFSCVSVFASETDDRIESSAKNSHVFKTYLKDDSINVKSVDGSVTLTGKVEEENHKGLAEETVASLPGVKNVENQLQVKGSTDKNSDAWISARVKAALILHRNVSGLGTQVNVQNGVATLRGEADSLAEKDLATNIVKDIDGVKDVKNEMTVVAGTKKSDETMKDRIDDASITAQVKMALLTHRSTSAIRTNVATSSGVVTLTGRAKNGAEKDLVTALVSDINGVDRVVNNMSVELQ